MKLSDSENRTWYSFIRENARRYATHIPHGYAHSGKSIVPSSDSVSYDFAKNGKKHCTKYEPVITAGPDPPLLVQSTEIYHKHIGMIPNYLGHIPGAMFRCGKTFGADTKDAKKWLRGDCVL